MNFIKFFSAVSLAMLLVAVSTAWSQQPASQATVNSAVPTLVNFAGTLTDLNGKPLTGVVGVTFSLYSAEQASSPLWLETQNVTADKYGHYSVQLGVTRTAGLPSDIFIAGEARWLGVRPQGQAEYPRVMLLSVPYAMKAGDAQTLGGLPASAFILATSGTSAPVPAAQAPGSAAPAASSVTTSGGTVNTLPLFTTSTNIQSSALTQTGTGSAAKIGIGTTTPVSTLDVKGGATVRGALALTAIGTATTAAGANSQPERLTASAFNSSTSSAVPQVFLWQAEPVGNNTSTATASLNLLFGQGTAKPAETGLKVASNGQLTFAAGQTFPGAGTITGVTAGTDLLGGGTTGSVTLNLDTTRVPQLSGGNTFTGNQSVNGSVSGTQLISTVPPGTAPLQVASTTLVPNLNANLLGGFPASAFQAAGSYATLGSNTFSGSQVINSGDLSLSNGNLDLPQTTATAGVINLGGLPFAHVCCSATQNNLFVGVQAGNLKTTGATNTAEGFQAMFSNTTGCCNVANGTSALYSNTQGCCNVADGQAALISNTTGSNNTADGYQALFATTTGNYNTAIGIDAMTNNTTGSNNTALGRAAGGSPGVLGNLTGSGNTFLGTGAIPGSSALNNSTAIGNGAEVDVSNAMVLGAIAGVNGATANTSVGIGTTSPAYSLDVHGTANFTGVISFSPSQTFPGTGTITAVTPGAGLAGGGSSGNVALSLATSLCATGNALTGLPFNCAAFATLGSNSFTGDQIVAGNISASGVITGDASGLTNLPVLYSSFVPTCDLNIPGSLSSTPVDMGTLGTFTKQRAASSIVIDWGGHVNVGAVSNVVYFFIEVDGNAAVGGQANGLLFSADAGRYLQLPMHAVFTGLSTGTHDVQMWVSIPNGTGSAVAENPGCYSEQVTIQEL